MWQPITIEENVTLSVKLFAALALRQSYISIPSTALKMDFLHHSHEPNLGDFPVIRSWKLIGFWRLGLLER